MSHFVFSHVLQEIWRYIHLRNTNNVMYNCPSHPRNTHLKKITSHSPHHNVQVDIYKDPGALPPNTEATHRRDKCQNDVQKYFSLQEWERSAVVRFIMQIENYTSYIKIKVHLNIQKEWERKEKIVDHMSFLTVTTHWRIYSFFFYFWGLFKRYLYLFTMPYSNEH